jgi:hypothetical protein
MYANVFAANTTNTYTDILQCKQMYLLHIHQIHTLTFYNISKCICCIYNKYVHTLTFLQCKQIYLLHSHQMHT